MPGAFRFIDLPTAAERLGTTRFQLLQWVDEGRIKPFSGKGQQSVFRAADVDRLASELGEAAAQESLRAATGEAQGIETARKRKRDPIRLIGTRLSMDSRWAEISDQDIIAWLDALEPVQYERVRKVANLGISRLQRLLQMLNDFEQRTEQ